VAVASLALVGIAAVGVDRAHSFEDENRILGYSAVPSTTQAGGHPDLKIVVWAKDQNVIQEPSQECECQDPRNLYFDMPGGLIADPHALPQCTDADFATTNCPTESQIGLVAIGFNGASPPLNPLFPTPVYNLVPRPGQAGLIGFPAPIINSPVFTVASARTEGDYGLNLSTLDVTHPLQIGTSTIELTIWGVPADPVHDIGRLGPQGCDATHTSPIEDCVEGFGSNAPPQPYLSNPTSCGQTPTIDVEIEWYDHFRQSSSSPFPATTGCDLLGFNPSLFGRPTTTQTETASGFDADLLVPQNTTPTVPLPSSIRGTDVTLPEGFTINANAGDGKVSCSDAQANFGSRGLPAECPEFAKVGSASIESSVLPGPLPGFVYLADPKPDDRYRLLLAADGFGLHVKLPGRIIPDPDTGRVTTSFQDLPQFPFTRFNLHFFGSERGVLATPNRCGSYPVVSRFTPWDSELPQQTSTQFFNLDAGPGGGACPDLPLPFVPDFKAGVADKTAGLHSPFSVMVSRDDGEQSLTGLSISTPPGFAATLKGIPYCPEVAINRLSDPSYRGLEEQISPSCPAASRVGSVVAGAGTGSRPVHVSGAAYLAGPYRGAPLSLLVVVPVVSGPYDLGNIPVRVPVTVDPVTARVTATSDPLPRIIAGIPLRTRSIQVKLDRPGFALNPTNCDRFHVRATVTGDEGGITGPGTHFQVANCADLGYGPKLKLKLSGGVQRRGHPAIRAILTTRPGEANTRRVAVTLPKGGIVDNSHIDTICTRVQFAADNCPPGARIGHATAETPLLDEPLRGPVILRSSANPLPDMVLDLKGQLDIELSGRIDTARGGRLRTTFTAVPDAPVTKFTLDLRGGKKGLLLNSTSLCSGPEFADVRMSGQNGKRSNGRSKLHVACEGRHRHD
jgi:hypothetical protein